MNKFTFSPEVIKTYPILDGAEVIHSNNLDSQAIQDVIINSLIPTDIAQINSRLILCTVISGNGIAHWNLTFWNCSDGIDKEISENAFLLDDSFDHYTEYGHPILKISFKVG